MRFVFSTGSLHTYGIDRCFALAAQAGFEGIELMVDRRWDTRQPEYVRRLIEACELPVVAVHVPLESSDTPGWPRDMPGRVGATVALAESLGASVVVHHLPLRVAVGWVSLRGTRIPFPLPARDPYEQWFRHDYASLQAQTSVTLCVENLPAVRVMGRDTNPACWNTLAQIQRFSALTMDTTHLGTWGLDPVAFYEQLAGRVRHVHLSNYNGQEHRRPDDGRMRLDCLLARMAADGYDGAVSIELSPEALNAGQPDAAVTRDMAAILAWCRAAASKVSSPQA